MPEYMGCWYELKYTGTVRRLESGIAIRKNTDIKTPKIRVLVFKIKSALVKKSEDSQKLHGMS